MKKLITIAAIAILLGGCAPNRIDPPLLTYPSENLTLLSAQAHTKDLKGELYRIEDTHSMEPTLFGGDYVVVAPIAFDSLKLGQIIAYRAAWTAAGSPPVVHRLAARDGLGWILSGDNNARSEPGYRVTAENYIGLVVGRYRVKP